MQQMIIVGVDVSKSTLDIFFKPADTVAHISNDIKGFKQWFTLLKSLLNPDVKVMVIMEHTGRYCVHFESFLRSVGIDYCKIAALQIKKSLGMTRGKTDKADAQRIAEYGWLRRELLTADNHPGDEIIELRNLLSLRTKLVADRAGYISRIKEQTIITGGDKQMWRIQKQVIDFLTKKIAVIEKNIQLLIASHESLQKTHELLTSIKGIGWVIAAYMIGCTENFTRFRNARKFNCYAGIAPFKHESGSSIKARARISHLANKQAKTLLDCAACCAIQHNPEMKSYYQRRINEGKAKRSCINIIRAKLVARMFAIIKRQTPYQQLAPAA